MHQSQAAWRVCLVLGAFLIVGVALVVLLADTAARELPILLISLMLTGIALLLYAGISAAKQITLLTHGIKDLEVRSAVQIDEVTQSRDRFVSVLDGLAEGVVAFDLQQRVLHINAAASNMLNVGSGLAGENFHDLPTAREVKQLVETCITQQTSVASTVIFGGVILECTGILMPSVDGESSGGILVIEDITERQRLEEVRSDFVANASHELKTPISAIRGLIETIIDDPDMPDEVFSRFMERIRQQTIRLDQIVQDLLQLSRFDSSSRGRVVTQVELAGLLRLVYQAKLEDAADAELELELALDVESLRIDGEVEAINQMITNLVDNAIKYSAEGGKVKVRLSRVGEMASIEVIDDGIGIAKDETQRIFERFYRVDRARSRDLGGTGLGLAIVKHIAQSHHGSVTVDSQLGRGSTFTVQIPLG